MAEKKQTDQVDSDAIKQQLEQLSGNALKTSSPAFSTFAQFQKQRADRLKQGLKQIKKDLGADSPEFALAQAAQKRAALLNMQFATQSARIKHRPVPKANEWMVYGQVVDASSGPVAGVRVRVFDHDRKYDDLLGDTQTDENGEFSVIYHERDFLESNENLPELYVMVTDEKGNLLYTSKDNLRFNAGRSEYFLIQLGKGPVASRVDKAAG